MIKCPFKVWATRLWCRICANLRNSLSPAKYPCTEMPQNMLRKFAKYILKRIHWYIFWNLMPQRWNWIFLQKKINKNIPAQKYRKIYSEISQNLVNIFAKCSFENRDDYCIRCWFFCWYSLPKKCCPFLNTSKIWQHFLNIQYICYC